MLINKGRPSLKILDLLAAASILFFLVESKNSKMNRLSKRTAAAFKYGAVTNCFIRHL